MNNSTRLTQAQRKTLQSSLRARLLALQRRIGASDRGASKFEPVRNADQQDIDDRAQRDGHHEVDVALSDIDRTDLAAIETALRGVNDASYGLCSGCGQSIVFDRLALEPQAVRCASCQQLYDKQITVSEGAHGKTQRK